MARYRGWFGAVFVGLAVTAACAAPARAGGTTERVSVGPGGAQGNDSSGNPAISADGRFVAFYSDATNLVPGDTNARVDVFVHDRRTGVTKRVSVGPGGAQGNEGSAFKAISADGRFVAFASEATNLVRGDSNEAQDVFVRDRRTAVTRRVSVGPGGAQANGFSASNSGPAISADGRFVAFASSASDLVPDDTNGTEDVFVRDRQAGVTERVSVGRNGAQANRTSGFTCCMAISAEGRFVAFVSSARNLVPGDTNGTEDVFVRDRQAGVTERVSVRPRGAQAGGGDWPAISADGCFVAFASGAANVVPGDTNGARDVFVRSRCAVPTRD